MDAGQVRVGEGDLAHVEPVTGHEVDDSRGQPGRLGLPPADMPRVASGLRAACERYAELLQRLETNQSEFQRLARDRVETVRTLSVTRFDWAHAMREVGRVVPADVWLTGLSGSSGAGR